MGRLENKIALITGAARGIGESIARVFHREGAMVILSDILDEKGKALAQELGEMTCYSHLDVTNEEDWKLVYQKLLLEFGGLGISLN